MGENWIGKAVSIKCVDDFGIFQGIIKDADSGKIVISRAFRNGLPIKTLDTEVTIMYARHSDQTGCNPMTVIFNTIFFYLAMLRRAADIGKISLIPSHNSANVNSGISTMASNNRDRDEPPANYTLHRKEINACVPLVSVRSLNRID